MTKAVARRAGGRAFGIGAASAPSYRVDGQDGRSCVFSSYPAISYSSNSGSNRKFSTGWHAR
ncbi:hypothetical protein [Plesiomonas shigelloides]|uniref:hypothetical protein n=1 Tax=Plesiomonas shigelloides TaxID=703 RepID=UPI0012E0B446|nr:hypothetical protein [Plesiomonas shigelloides]